MGNRAGRYVRQLTGYSSFQPSPLPPDPPIAYDSEMIRLLSSADRALGRLDGITQTLPNPDLFVSMYVKKEALLSSQIEGTQASLVEVLAAEEQQSKDAREVTNYVRAMNYGIRRLDELPLSLRLFREIHGKLLTSGRGSEYQPGEFRTTQNWIGRAGSTLQDAAHIPPCVDDMHEALHDLERYIHEDDDTPPLIKIALIHAQFETIHPFVDGNGRMGRLMITFWLYQQAILRQPLLYLSYYFKRNRTEYYDRLMAVRMEGAWEEWVKFFLQGIIEISEESSESAMRINRLREEKTTEIDARAGSAAANAHKLLDLLFITPAVTRTSVAEALGVSSPTAANLISRFVDDFGILVDTTPLAQRKKTYLFREYMDILEVGTA
ncbi:MAG: Fic family protein [Eggerthellaceae bacterium]|nr:Fic family protein [Eggerthellaceae bacterium]